MVAASFSSWPYRLALATLLMRCTTDLVVCPYSKVEESFGMQAIHDLLYHGTTDLDSYDHVQYPGVVPRTFVGPAVVAGLVHTVRLVVLPLYDIFQRPLLTQLLARLVLLLFNVRAWHCWANALERQCRGAGTYLLLITSCQFHLPFYASRCLPNTWAMVITSHAITCWLQGHVGAALALLTMTTVVLRCDVLLLLAPCTLTWLLTGQITTYRAIQVGTVTAIASLALTLPLDSLFWREWMWPEGHVLYFNTVLGKSSDYGVTAWHWYVTNALPKALLLTVLPLPFMLVRQVPRQAIIRRWQHWLDTSYWQFLLPAMAFVALYSKLGHKEVRFLFPALSIFNMCSAVGLARLHQAVFVANKESDEKRPHGGAQILYAVGMMGLVASALASGVFVAVSAHNYPGGDALARLVSHIRQQQQQQSHTTTTTQVQVHIDVAAAMTGVTLFGQRHAQYAMPDMVWTFVKAGYEDANAQPQHTNYTHLLTEHGAVDGYVRVAAIAGHPRFSLRNLQIQTTDAIYVLEKE